MSTIDSLQIEIGASASKASEGLNKLAKSLEGVKDNARGGAGLNSLRKKLDSFSSTLDSIDDSAIERFERLTDALGSLSGASDVKLSKSIATAIESISTALSGIDESKLSALDGLSRSLNSLNSVKDLKISSTISTQIKSLSDAVSGINVEDLNKVSELSGSLQSLSGLSEIKLSSSIANQLQNITASAELMQGVDFSGFSSIAENLKPLTELNSADGLKQTVKQLERLPEITNSLNSETISEFAQKIKGLNDALTPLANNMNQISNGFKSFPAQMTQVANATASLNTSAESSKKSTTGLLSSFMMLYGSLKGTTMTVSKWIDQSNKYVEDLNLFTASLGRFAEKSQAYAESVSEIMGIDPSNWLRNQGVFMTLATGFGVAGDRAHVMSQQLTQLGYDIASFFNVSVEDSMQRLQSALAGELEPVRRLGMDLSEARLKAIALSLGIQKSYTAMNQAEKSQLRYYAIMTQVTTAQGDMARTLESPANQLRILQAQTTQAARALGNIFIPALNSIIPYAIAAVKAIRSVANAIAKLFGFSMPTVDYSSISNSMQSAAGGAGDLESNLGGAGKKAKELKSTLASFDEINLIANESDPSGGGGGGGSEIDSTDWDFELPTYDFLDGLISTKLDGIYKKIEPIVTFIEDHARDILNLVEIIGTGLAMWKVADTFVPDLKKGMEWLKKLKGVIATIGVVAITLEMSAHFTDQFLENGSLTGLVGSGATVGFGAWLSEKIMEASGFTTISGFMPTIVIGLDVLFKINQISDKVVTNGWTGRNIVATLLTSLEAGFAAGFAAHALGASTSVMIASGAITIAVAAVAIIAISTIKMKMDANDPAKLVEWGKNELTADQINEWVNDQFSFNVDARIKSMTLTLDNRETSIDNMNATIESFNSSLKLLKIGVDTSPQAIESLSSQITGEGGLLDNLRNYLTTNEENFKLSLSYVTPTDSEGNSLTDGMFAAMLATDSFVMNTATDIGNQISKYLAEGFAKGIESEEMKMAFALSDTLMRINKAATKGEMAGEQNAKTQLLLSGMTEKSAKDALSAYASLEEEVRAKTNAMAISEMADITSRKASAYESMMHYESIGDTDKYNEAKKYYEYWTDKLDSFDLTRTQMDNFMAVVSESRALVIDQLQSVYEGAMENVTQKIDTDWLEDAKQHYSDNVIENGYAEYSAYVNQMLDNAMKQGLGKNGYSELSDFATSIGVSMWSLLTDDVKSSIYNSMVETLGSTDASNILNELNYDIPVGVEIDEESVSEGQKEIEKIADDNVTSNLERMTGEVNDFQTTLNGVSTETLETTVSTGLSNVDKNIQNTIDKAYKLRQTLSFIESMGSGMRTFSARAYHVATPKAYATGGMPETGEVFIAREAGAEMVGSIGRRTAVANNDQIVSGIAGGVASANSEQNSLLREQNGLLRQILAKEGKVVFPTSAEAGRAVQKSIKMYDVARGMA